mgnify:CR=1 FL=1
MKTKFLTILLFLFPIMLFAQNYEKDGDVCFEKGEYHPSSQDETLPIHKKYLQFVYSEKGKNSISLRCWRND